MRAAVVICAVVLASCLVDADRDVDAQRVRLEDITDDFRAFRAKIDRKIEEAKEVEKDIEKVKKDLKKIEPTGCDDRLELQCGGDKPKCISRLLVCDTRSDCANGYDESQCATYTPSGSIWKGTMIYDHCTKSRPKTLLLSIENYKIIDYFRPFPEVTATLEMDVDMANRDPSKAITLFGSMDLKPGEHILYFPPPDTNGLSLACVFDGVDVDHCHGEIIRESSQEICAELYVERLDSHF